ncbi:MAG: hypothetical protein ACI8S6_004998, partial [Myxococcota bacterium]
GTELKRALSVEAFTLGEATVHVLRLDYTTGEGWDLCGGDELNESFVAVIEGDKLRMDPARVHRSTMALPVRFDGGVHVLVDDFLDQVRMVQGDAMTCEDPIDFCDCAC